MEWWMVNREALPLIAAMLIPISLVIVILLYIYGYDAISFFREINLIYYIVIFPIVLGFLIAVSRVKKVD
jgi:hypothetical protein